MRDEHENAILLEVRDWLPPGWTAVGRNGEPWASIRLVDPNNAIRGRLILHRKSPEPAVTGVLVTRRPRPCTGSACTDGPTWDLRDPDSIDHIERWVRTAIFGGFTGRRPVSRGGAALAAHTGESPS